jgi:hypothetical protein
MALAVQGLTALEDAEVVDLDPNLPPEIRKSEIARRVIAAVLLADGARAFASADDVGALTEPEVHALGAAVFQATSVVCPMRRAVHEDAWHDRLVLGAKHPVNRSTTRAISLSTETLVAPARFVSLSAPDRYFGIPLAALTDGQLMAYEAAKAVFDK